MARTDGLHSAVPIICVGNFTAGGTGKTPFVCWLVDLLKQRGLNPAIITRGFGGRMIGPVWVQRDSHTAIDVGDEPLLLAKHAPVMVARTRAEGVHAITQNENKFDVIIMDDGLQNPSINKDLAIALIDGKRGFGNGRVIPAGPLRASLGCQLQCISAVVINQGSGPNSSQPKSASIAADLRQREFEGPIMGASVTASDKLATLSGKRVLAFAGIGHPQRFFETVRSLGAELVGERVFADHHVVTRSEAVGLVQSAETQGLTLVTTEKDWVRLSDQDPVVQKLKSATQVVPITLKMSESDIETVAALVEARCGASFKEKL